MSDITTLEQDIAELRAALDAMARKLDTVLVQAGKAGINMPVVTDANGATGKETPKDALDVRGYINIAADPPRIYAENDNPTSAQGPYLQLIDGSDRSNAFGLKAGGVLVSDKYNYAHPPSGDLIVQGKVGIGTPTPTQPLHVKGNASVTGEITEGGKKLKEKYQPAGKYQLAGDYHEKGDSVGVTTKDTDNASTASALLQIVGINGTPNEPNARPGARIRIGGPSSKVTMGGFRIDRAGTNLLEVDHGGNLHVPGALKLGDVTITLEPVELFSRIKLREVNVGSGAFERRVSIDEHKWFLTAPGAPWTPENKSSVALVLRKKGQEPILIASFAE